MPILNYRVSITRPVDPDRPTSATQETVYERSLTYRDDFNVRKTVDGIIVETGSPFRVDLDQSEVRNNTLKSMASDPTVTLAFDAKGKQRITLANGSTRVLLAANPGVAPANLDDEEILALAYQLMAWAVMRSMPLSVLRPENLLNQVVTQGEPQPEIGFPIPGAGEES